MRKSNIGIIIQDQQVYTVDAERKNRVRKIGPIGVTLAETDGTVIAIVHPSGQTRCYDARRGSFLGRVGKKDISSLSAVDGRLIIGHDHRAFEIINLRETFPNPYDGIEGKLKTLMQNVRKHLP